jgi:erythronate-4-phosphate dehydrogenase
LLIVADKNIPLLAETFGRHAGLRLRSGREIAPADLVGADALLVKSITPVTRTLLEASAIRFVGSATIGFDHMDVEWMDAHGITWTNAPGCNADAAAQYTLAMLLLACERLGRDPRKLTAGIIGRGNVGSRVQRLLGVLGLETVANDPPLAAAGEAGLVSLEEALTRDLVCLHVPLTRTGPYPTWRMLGPAALAHMRAGALLLNSARGNVVDGDALLGELQSGRLHAALDVWPGEPAIDPGLLAATTVATPHVAGYSEEGRRNGALMIYRAFCRWAGIEPVTDGVPAAPRHELQAERDADQVARVIRRVSHVEEDDRAMRALTALDPASRRLAFDRLRKNYPLRSDFGAWRLRGCASSAARTLGALGFRLG